MNKSLLYRSIWRYFFKHPWLIILSILGVAIGVAVVISVDIANGSAQRAFELSIQNFTGKASHQIISSDPFGLDENLYVRLKNEFRELTSSATVEGYVTMDGETLQLMGVDLFSAILFTDQLSGIKSPTLVNLIIEPDTILVPERTASRIGISPGDSIVLTIGGEEKTVRVVDFVGKDQESALDGILISDISAGQELLDKVGILDRINLYIPEDNMELLSELKSWLPSNTSLISTSARNESTLKITDAFSVNLTAMSLLALMVGMFLIYNTMTFSVLHRRRHIGTLRILGVTKKEIFTEVIIEAGTIGFAGTLAGVLLGIWLGQAMVGLVTNTFNDLYFVLTVNTFVISGGMIIKGVLLGTVVSILAACIPALEAASAPPQVARLRSVIESLVHRIIPYIALTGAILIIIAVVVLFASGTNIIAGFVSLFLIVLGYAFSLPIIVNVLCRRFGSTAGNRTGILSKIAVMGISNSLSRTGTAIAALSVALSVVVGMGVMIESFRESVDRWLVQALQGDIYVTTTSLVSQRSENPIPENLIREIYTLEGIQSVKEMKIVYLQTPDSFVEVHAIDPVLPARREYRLKEVSSSQIWSDFEKGEVIFLAEPYAYKNNVSIGDTVSFITNEGEKKFKVGAIFFDYASDRGIILMPQSLYVRFWQDNTISSMALYLEETVSKEEMITRIHSHTDNTPGVLVRDNAEIRQAGLEVFDRTFLITRVLEFLAMVVAFIGILSTLMAYQIEKTKEIGILRALGVTSGQIWRLMAFQTGFMGIISGLFSIPLGIIMAVVLIFVINLRSFGWSMALSISPTSIIEAIAIAVVTSLLASMYPAWRMSKISPVEALREE
ncbi:MAG: FtsX-like permease family protein [Dehalococcoidales bacterium]|nr:FtsX-like permease family protein [Dehalococcoidales bacterium]